MDTPNCEDIWRNLKLGLQEILAGKEIGHKRYMDLFTDVFRFIHADGSLAKVYLLPRKKNYLSVLERGTVFFEFMSWELRGRMIDFLEEHLKEAFKEANNKHGAELLEFYLTVFKEYSSRTKLIGAIFTQVNKSPEMPSVLEMCLDVLRMVVSSKILSQVIEASFDYLMDLHRKNVDQMELATRTMESLCDLFRKLIRDTNSNKFIQSLLKKSISGQWANMGIYE